MTVQLLTSASKYVLASCADSTCTLTFLLLPAVLIIKKNSFGNYFNWFG